MKLTEHQKQFFNTFGYLCVRQVFAADEVAWICSEFEQTIQEFGQGRNHDGTKRTMFGGPIEHRPKMCGLLDDPRVVGLIGGVLGDDFNYAGGDGNYYSGDTGWHPDGNWGQLFAAKLAFYLDPLTRETGALRVIPGSQRPQHPIRTGEQNLAKSQELYGVAPRDYPGVEALETTPGDLVIFNHDTWHSAFGGGKRRRMFTMNVTRRAKTPEDIKTLRDYLGVHSAGGYKIDTGAGMYFPTMLETADARRHAHLEQCAQIHDELFPQYSRNALR